MPEPALPIPFATAGVGRTRFRRFFHDVLDRPLRGVVTLSGTDPIRDGDSYTMPIAVTKDLVDGWLDVELPPDEYTLVAQLRGEHGEPLFQSFTVMIGE